MLVKSWFTDSGSIDGRQEFVGTQEFVSTQEFDSWQDGRIATGS